MSTTAPTTQVTIDPNETSPLSFEDINFNFEETGFEAASESEDNAEEATPDTEDEAEDVPPQATNTNMSSTSGTQQGNQQGTQEPHKENPTYQGPDRMLYKMI